MRRSTRDGSGAGGGKEASRFGGWRFLNPGSVGNPLDGILKGDRMQTRRVDIPEELLERLQHSRLGRRSETDQVKIALAIHLFLEDLISIGKAAELAGDPRIDF